MFSSRLTSKGQVTVPAKIRRALGAEEGDEIVFTLAEGDAAIVRVIKRRQLLDLYGSLSASRAFPGRDAVRSAVREAVARRALGAESQKP